MSPGTHWIEGSDRPGRWFTRLISSPTGQRANTDRYPAAILRPSAMAQTINEAKSPSPSTLLFRSAFSVSMLHMRRLHQSPPPARRSVEPVWQYVLSQTGFVHQHLDPHVWWTLREETAFGPRLCVFFRPWSTMAAYSFFFRRDLVRPRRTFFTRDREGWKNTAMSFHSSGMSRRFANSCTCARTRPASSCGFARTTA